MPVSNGQLFSVAPIPEEAASQGQGALHLRRALELEWHELAAVHGAAIREQDSVLVG